MPLFDLRVGDAIDPLAIVKVLAVMTHPEDRVMRERMIANPQAFMGKAGRRAQLSDDELIRVVGAAARRAGVAGAVLLMRLRLHLEGIPPTLNNAIELISQQLPRYEPVADWHARNEEGDRRIRTHRQEILLNNRAFLPVAHLWAVALHQQQNELPDILLGREPDLPQFLAKADAILTAATKMQVPRRERQGLPTRAMAWRFAIPANRVRQARLVPAPLPPELLAGLRRAPQP